MKKNDVIRLSSNGFSLVEVVVAIAIIAFGLLCFFTIFSTTASDISISIEESYATNCANELIEAVMANNFKDIPEKIDMAEIDGNSSEKFFDKIRNGISPIQKGFKRFLEISSADASFKIPQDADPFQKSRIECMNKFKIIVVKIKYSQNGQPKEFKIGTLMTSS